MPDGWPNPGCAEACCVATWPNGDGFAAAAGCWADGWPNAEGLAFWLTVPNGDAAAPPKGAGPDGCPNPVCPNAGWVLPGCAGWLNAGFPNALCPPMAEGCPNGDGFWPRLDGCPKADGWPRVAVCPNADGWPKAVDDGLLPSADGWPKAVAVELAPNADGWPKVVDEELPPNALVGAGADDWPKADGGWFVLEPVFPFTMSIRFGCSLSPSMMYWMAPLISLNAISICFTDSAYRASASCVAWFILPAAAAW